VPRGRLADLDLSTKTAIKGSGSIAKGRLAGVFHFGTASTGGRDPERPASTPLLPMGLTFLVFADYMRA
jgi:hypothetical protein